MFAERPDRHLAVAVLADDECVDRARIDAEVVRQRGPETGGVEDRARPDDTFRRQPGQPPRLVRQHVDRVGRDQDDAGRVGLGHLGHDLTEDRRVLADQVKARLARLLPGARRDHRDGRAGAIGIRTGPHAGRLRERHGVLQVHRLALGASLVRVDQHDLRGDARQQQGVSERRSDVADPDDRDAGGTHALHSPRVARTAPIGRGQLTREPAVDILLRPRVVQVVGSRSNEDRS